MNKLIITSAAAALMIGASGIATAATPADCQTLFQKADINKDGSLQSEEAKVFLDAMDKAQVKPADAAMVKQDEFMAACEKDAFASIDPASIGSSQTAAAPAEQPAATTDQSAATTDQSSGAATTTEPAATAEQTTTATTDQSQQPATTETEQALAVPEGYMASNIMGATVNSASDENLGEIKDVILASKGGQATHAIIDVGDKDVAVELSQLKIVATDNGLKVMLNASKADLDGLPAIANK
ncbi:MAG TPA: PRC-barrel domain-containing protein [Aestuariivirgaceae bacterium]|nr:PRC-barrel domain-containing protein [Aestuariivirgaceae bacterium]